MRKNSKIYVAGHTGLVGSAICRRLETLGFDNIITRTRKELNLCDQKKVSEFFNIEHPEYVFLAAAKVGGIGANSHQPAYFIRENLQIQTNIIHNSYIFDVKKLLCLGSSCIYPRNAKQPITEDQLLTSQLEPSNAAYAVAKIAGIVMCQSYNKQLGTNFISAMPTNLYGPGDKYSDSESHVIPAMIKKFHNAKVTDAERVVLWGDGTPLREFLYVDDLAEALVALMQEYNSTQIINIGSGDEISIEDLAHLIASTVGYKGKIVFDKNKPNGTPRKLLDSSKIKPLGWKPEVFLAHGLHLAYEDYLSRRPWENAAPIISTSDNSG